MMSRWHAWLDTVLIAAILVVDAMLLVKS